MFHKEKLRYRQNLCSSHIKTNQNSQEVWGLEKQQKDTDHNTLFHHNHKYISQYFLCFSIHNQSKLRH